MPTSFSLEYFLKFPKCWGWVCGLCFTALSKHIFVRVWFNLLHFVLFEDMYHSFSTMTDNEEEKKKNK